MSAPANEPWFRLNSSMSHAHRAMAGSASIARESRGLVGAPIASQRSLVPPARRSAFRHRSRDAIRVPRWKRPAHHPARHASQRDMRFSVDTPLSANTRFQIGGRDKYLHLTALGEHGVNWMTVPPMWLRPPHYG